MEIVDLIETPEIREALDGSLQVGSDELEVSLRLECQASITLVGILEISLIEQLVESFTVLGSVAAAGLGHIDGQKWGTGESNHENAEEFHESLARLCNASGESESHAEGPSLTITISNTPIFPCAGKNQTSMAWRPPLGIS
jgi:hypothetical protein